MVRTKSFKRALRAVRYWRIGGLNHPITNPPIHQWLSARVGASVTACTVQKAPIARAGHGDADHGAKAFADGGTAQTPRRRDAGAEGGIPPRFMRPPVRMDAQDLNRTQRRWRSGGETFPANAPRATAGCIGPKAERTDAKSRAPLSGRPRRQSSDCRGGRTQRGVRFSRGSTVGPMQPADSDTASRSKQKS